MFSGKLLFAMSTRQAFLISGGALGPPSAVAAMPFVAEQTTSKSCRLAGCSASTDSALWPGISGLPFTSSGLPVCTSTRRVVFVEGVDGRRVVVAPEIGELEREAVPAPFESRADLETRDRIPERVRVALAGEPDAGEAVAPEPKVLPQTSQTV